MQIEFINNQVPQIVLLHFDPKMESPEQVEYVQKGVIDATQGRSAVLLVPNGKPVSKNGPSFYVCRDSGLMMEIVKKLSKSQPGSIIPLSDKEMRALGNPHNFRAIPLPGDDQ